MRHRRLRRRYGRAKRGSGAVRYYRIIVNRFGPAAVAYDYKGASVNLINGSWSAGDTVESVRRAAHKAWPNAKDRTPR
jgi:hypothetical protein